MLDSEGEESNSISRASSSVSSNSTQFSTLIMSQQGYWLSACVSKLHLVNMSGVCLCVCVPEYVCERDLLISVVLLSVKRLNSTL